MIIDIFPVVLLLILLIGMKPMKPLSAINECYLSMNTTKCYKGLLAIIIVFHHLSIRTHSGIAFRLFTFVGCPAVAVFFFFSGYGLQKSYITKAEQYCNGFLKKRLSAILLPYVVITFLYWIMYYLTGKFYTFRNIIDRLLSGKPIVSFSWYVITILLFYIFFWILMKLCNTNYFAMIIGGSVWYMLYAISCIIMGYDSLWYNTAHLLILGMIWAIKEKEILSAINKYQVFIPLCWLTFVLLFIIKIFLERYTSVNGIVSLLTVLDLLNYAVFAVCILGFSMKVRINNKILLFLGEISFEIYLIHGLFIALLRNDSFYIKNEFLWVLGVLLFSISGSFVLHFLFTKLLKRTKTSH